MPKTREAQLEAWFRRGWRVSTTGSGALWKNLRGYHLAVWEDREHPGEWNWRFKPEDSGAYDYSSGRYPSEEEAKRAVLEKLADALGL